MTPDEALERLRIANAVPCVEEVEAAELAVVTALFDERRSTMTARFNEHSISTSPERRHPRRAILVFALAMTLILAAVGVIALIPGGEDEVVSPQNTAPAVVTTAPPSTTPPTTRGSVDSTVAPLVPTWTRVAHDDAVFGDGSAGVSINDVAVGADGLVAVGSRLHTDGQSQGAIWVSADGVSWSKVPHDDAVLGSRYGWVTLNDVISYGAGYIAIGCRETGPPLMLASPDGVSWSIVDLGADLLSEPVYEELLAEWARTDSGFDTGTPGLHWSINGLAADGDRIIAVGSAGYGGGSPAPGASFDGARFAVVWTSTDGINWTRIPHDDEVFGGLQDGVQSMGAATVTAQGYVVVGADSAGSDFDAAVWTSPDGLSWQRVSHDEAVFGGDAPEGRRLDQWMVDVIGVGNGVLAVGTETSGPEVPDDPAQDDSDGAIWLSPDGVTWRRLPHDADLFGGDKDQTVCCVAHSSDGFVAVGYDQVDTDGWDPLAYEAVVWTSSDGVDWARSAAGDFGAGSFMKSVLPLDGRTVAVGGVNNDNPLGAGAAAVWIRE